MFSACVSSCGEPDDHCEQSFAHKLYIETASLRYVFGSVVLVRRIVQNAIDILANDNDMASHRCEFSDELSDVNSLCTLLCILFRREKEKKTSD